MLDCNTFARADRDDDPRSGSTRPMLVLRE